MQVIGGDEGLVGGGGDDEAGRHGQAGLCQLGQVLGLAAGGGQGGEGGVEGEDGRVHIGVGMEDLNDCGQRMRKAEAVELDSLPQDALTGNEAPVFC